MRDRGAATSVRTNVVYYLANSIATPREDGSDSRLPTKQMPMGLIEHIANFFSAEEMRKVRGLCSGVWLV